MFQPLTFESCFQFPADDAAGCGVQGVRERAQVFETLNFFLKRPDVAVLCAFSSNTIACSCSMSATGAPSKALKVRPSAAKHYQLRHSCPLPNSVVKCVPGFTVRLLSCISQSELITVLTTGLVYCGSYTPSGMPGAKHADRAYQLVHVDKE